MNRSDILILGVIYNTYPETIRYLDSLVPLASANISLILVDNSNKEKPVDFMKTIGNYPFVHYIETGKNLGYFGGAREGLRYYLQEHTIYPAWILVTNVDIVFSDEFFIRLRELNDQQNLGIVAPSILSQKWNTDYNPALLERYAESRLTFYQFLYSCFLLHNLFLIAAYFKKWILGLRHKKHVGSQSPVQPGSKIYAAHGSCLVFKNNYFLRGGTLNIPHFLFGEEVWVAEDAKRSGLDITYHPEMVIYDYEHASTGFFVTPKTNAFYRQSIRAIRDRYHH